MSGNKMALDALMACVAAIERTQHCTLEDRLAAFKAAALTKGQLAPQPQQEQSK